MASQSPIKQYRCALFSCIFAIFTSLVASNLQAITVVWNPNTESNLAGYRLYYGITNTPAAMLNVGNKTNVVLNSLTPGKRYFFYVTAYNTANAESSPSTSVFYNTPSTTPVPTLPIPAPPSNLAGTASSSTSVSLLWRDNSTNETGFRVFRKLGSTGTYTARTTGANAISFNDTGLTPSTTYFYKLQAFNASGNSAETPEISVRTLGNTTPTPTPTATNTAAFVRTDTTTSGTWRGVYGSKGVFAYPTSYLKDPTNVVINANGNYPLVWAHSTTSTRALQKRTGTDRFATAWQNTNSFYYYLQFKDSATHRVSFYFLDFDRRGRQQKVEFYDHVTGQFLGGTNIANFNNGVYSTWNLKGKIRVKFTRIAGPNAVLSGMFFDPATVTAASMTMASASSPANSAEFIETTTLTGGTWKGQAGAEGHTIARETASLPDSLSLTVSGATEWVWSLPSTDPAALERPAQAGRIASTWYGSAPFTADLAFDDSDSHRVSIYCVDFDRAGRTQRVELLDGDSGEVLDSTELSDFEAGAWLTYNVSGHVKVRVTPITGPNAVLSGMFFDPAAP